VELRVYSERDVDMERWQAEQVADVFRATYSLPLTVRVER
jgi:hypothetical protein